MKLRVMFICFLFYTTASFAGWINLDGTPEQDGPRVYLNYSDYDSTVITIAIHGFFCYDTTINDTTYKRIFIPKTSRTRIVGEPQLPIVYKYVGIPPTGGITITAESFKDTSFNDWIVFPLQDITDTTDTFIINNSLYSSDTVYHDSLVYSTDIGMMRNIRVDGLNISPFSYDIGDSSVTVSCSMRVKLTYEPPGEKDILSPDPYIVRKSFIPAYKYAIINYDYLDITTAEPYSPLLVITLNDFLSNYNLCEFLKWKHKCGDSLLFITYDSSPDTSTVVRNDILALIDTAGLPANMLIIGGPDDIPVGTDLFPPFLDWASDAFYSSIDSTDEIPDIPVGRFSIESTEELETAIEKTYNYERYINIDWNPGKYLFVAGEDVPPDSLIFVDAKKYIEDNIPITGANHSYWNDIETGTDSISMPINSPSGVGIVNYLGHGGGAGWANLCQNPGACPWMNDEIDSELDSISFAPIMLTFGCYNCDFILGDPCYGEKWVFTPNKGGAAAYGPIVTGPYDAARDSLTGEIIALYCNMMIDYSIYDLITNYNSYILGPTILGAAGISELFSWFRNVLIGDPSLDIWTAIEGSLKVAGYPVQMPPDTSDTLHLLVTDELSSPVDSALVCLWKGEFDTSTAQFDDEIFMIKYSDISGNVSFDLTSHAIFLPGSLYITATKHNYIPFEGEITIGTQIGFTVNSTDSAILNFDAWQRGDYVLSTNSDSVAIANIGNVSLDFALALTWWDSLYFIPADSNCYGCFWLWAQFTDSFPAPDTTSYDSLDGVLPDSLIFADSLYYGKAGQNLSPFQRNLLWFMMRTPEYFPDSLLNSTIQLKARQHIE